MVNRLTKIYTRTGDKGMTSLGDGSRVTKHDMRIQAMGDVDELNAVLGILLTEPIPDTTRHTLTDIQHDLFDLGAELCIPNHCVLKVERISELENTLDQLNSVLQPLKEFILPGGSRAAAYCHLARTVCRRAERTMHITHNKSPLTEVSLQYINRLSDYLFVLCRTLNQHANVPDVLWQNLAKA